MTAFQTSMADYLFSIVKAFNGHPYKFKQWVKCIGKYANLVRTGKDVYIVFKGLMADFVKKILEGNTFIRNISIFFSLQIQTYVLKKNARRGNNKFSHEFK